MVVDNASGQPVFGARVAISAGPDVTTLTDAKGDFSFRLEGASASTKDIEILAYAPGRFGSASAPIDDSTAVVSLGVIRTDSADDDYACGCKTLSRLYDNALSTRYYASDSILPDFALFDTARAQAMLDASGGEALAAGNLVKIVSRIDEAAPTTAMERRLLDLTGRYERGLGDGVEPGIVRLMLSILCVDTADVAKAATLYTAAAADLKPMCAVGAAKPDRLSAHDAGIVALLAADADAVGDSAGAASLSATAIAWVRSHVSHPHDVAVIANDLSRLGDARLADPVCEMGTADVQADCLRRVIENAARYSVTRATSLLPRLASLSADRTPDAPYSRALCAVATALAPRDGADAARQLAQEAGPGAARGEALAGAASAIADAKQRAELLAAAFADVDGDTHGAGGLWPASRIAAEAYDADPALGARLLDRVRSRVITAEALRSAAAGNGEYRDQAAYAFYNARREPAESRFIIEREYARESRRADRANNPRRLLPMIVAMAAADPARALEMARTMPIDPKNNFQVDTRMDTIRKIGQLLIARTSGIRTISFDRLLEADIWQPGTSEGW